eukprot:COSAG06_NODE_1494_length_9277_cov_4.340161_2_plen_61_part_00
MFGLSRASRKAHAVEMSVIKPHATLAGRAMCNAAAGGQQRRSQQQHWLPVTASSLGPGPP